MIFTKLITWYGKRTVYTALACILVLLGMGAYFAFRTSAPETTTPLIKKRVVVQEAGLLGAESIGLKTVGTVRAVSEARLQTEAAGRITSVRVSIGDRVTAGTILATIENSRESASLLQAQGAYESAEAANAQTAISLSDAQAQAQNIHRTAFTTADDIVRTLTDEFFSNPNTKNPSIRIDSQGDAVALNAERVALGVVLEEWKQKTLTPSTPSQDVSSQLSLLEEAERNTTRTGIFVSRLAQLVSESDPDDIFTAEVLAAYKSRFSVARTRIDTTLQTIATTRTEVQNAAQKNTGGTVSSDVAARIKQALGSLRSAQAAYEKTIIRSPISGVVNAMYLRANEFVGMNAPAAVVANNGALEITTSVNEEERSLIAVGNIVTINEDTQGTITRIAPGIDPQTGKIEIKISPTNETGISLENGTIVSLSLSGTSTVSPQQEELRIPLRALKITALGPVAFTVSENHTLVAHPVTLGALIGDIVVIESGIDKNTPIVTDARGLKEGDLVEITP